MPIQAGKDRTRIQNQVFKAEPKDLSPHHCGFLPGTHLPFSRYLLPLLSAFTGLRILASRQLFHRDPSQSLAPLPLPSSSSTGFLLLSPVPGGFLLLPEAL